MNYMRLMFLRQIVLFDRLPDDVGGEGGAFQGGVFAVGTVEVKIRICRKQFPPFDADGGEQGVDLLRAGRVGVRQFRLLFRVALLRPRHVHDRRGPGRQDPFAKLRNRFMHRLFGAERMRVFLQHDVVVMAVEDVEPDIGLLDVLRKMPAATGTHDDVAADVVPARRLREQGGHVVYECVAVADEKHFETGSVVFDDGL